LGSSGYRIINADQESWFIFLWVPADLMVSIGIILYESQLVKILLLYSAIGVLVVIVQGYIYELDGLNTCFRMLQSPYAAPALIACTIIMFRWRAVNRAHHLVCNDQALYQLVWSAAISKIWPGEIHFCVCSKRYPISLTLSLAGYLTPS
jgi:hypothetical protein